MNEEIINQYRQHLCGRYRKKRTAYNYYIFTRQALQWINKPIEQLTKEDLLKWQEHIIHKYMPNGNARRVSSVNNFLTWAKKKKLKIPVPKQVQSNKIVLSDKELEQYLEASKEYPLWHLIAPLQADGLVRPGEFREIKLKNIDFMNQNLYLDDTKTGDNYIILSPRLSEAIENYLPYRNPLPEYKEYLIIIPEGRYKGRTPGEQATFIRNLTKRIATKAGLTKHVTPYIIKPSVITNDFNKNVNPRIIQRKARHKNVETTLRYDHTDDEMVRRHFEMQKLDIETMNDKDKARLLFNRFLKGEIDFETYKQGLDFLYEKEKRFEEVGYV